MPHLIAAIDQGTTSTRCMLVDAHGSAVAFAQKEHRQFYPQPGWIEHDPMEIWMTTQTVIAEALNMAGVTARDIAAVGIANQRETVVVWEKASGHPICPAIVWQDIRSADICNRLAAEGGQDRFRAATGLPIATYFSGPKLRWLLDNTPDARRRAERGELLCGTIDTWLIWNLTGDVHVTDPTNASRTLLMNLASLQWDDDLLQAMDIPRAMLPAIRSSSEIYGLGRGLLAGVPVASALGDQHAALFGQACFAVGDVKNTYGTGAFMLLNTGHERVPSSYGLLTTLAYRLGDAEPVYALEGSVAITGALIQWLRDNLGLIEQAADVETLAGTVADNGGMYVVPAFSGLFAPYWRSDARGAIVGLTGYVNKGHFARAALEATAYQCREILDAMREDTGRPVTELKADGGMVQNRTLMQIQADLLGIPLITPAQHETTTLGAAYAAGLAVGFWRDTDELKRLWREGNCWLPAMDSAERERLLFGWKKAVTRTFDWVD